MRNPKWLVKLAVVVLCGAAFLAPAGISWGDGDFYVVAGGGGSKGKVLNTQLFTYSLIDNTLGSPTWEILINPIWTYNKVSATSMLVISYHDILSVPSGGISCYQIRVNDSPSDGGQASAALICSTLTDNSYSATGLWSNLPAGNVTLSIWHRQVGANSCLRNSGGYMTSVLVTEIEK